MFRELPPFGQNSISELKNIDKRELPPPVVDCDYIESLCSGEVELQKAYKEMINQAFVYTTMLCIMQKSLVGGELSAEQELAQLIKEEQEAHTLFITRVNNLAEQLKYYGKDGSWINKFNNERVRYGSFAVVVALNKIAA